MHAVVVRQTLEDCASGPAAEESSAVGDLVLEGALCFFAGGDHDVFAMECLATRSLSRDCAVATAVFSSAPVRLADLAAVFPPQNLIYVGLGASSKAIRCSHRAERRPTEDGNA